MPSKPITNTSTPLSDEESEMMDAIALRQNAMLDFTQSLANINSGSFNTQGIEKCLRLLEENVNPICTHIEKRRIKPIEQVSDGGEITSFTPAPMLIGKINPEASFQLLCTGHIDTVFPKNTHFKTTKIENDRMHGPGVADMKGGLVIMLEAINGILKSKLGHHIGFTIAISPDEEIGSLSSAEHLQELAAHAHYGLTYEPALEDGTLAGARKGSGNFSAIIHGKSVHAGREFFKGRNAVTCAAKLAVELEGLSDEKRGISCNIGRITGGNAVNIVPDKAVVFFNIRIPDSKCELDVKNKISNIIQSLSQESKCDIALQGKFNRPAKPTTRQQSLLFDLLKSCGSDLAIPIAFRDTGGCCEGNNLSSVGLNNIDTLGVCGANIHSDQEYALLNSFVERTQLSALFISRLFYQFEKNK